MSKQYAFKSTYTTSWIEDILDAIPGRQRSEFIREAVIAALKPKVEQMVSKGEPKVEQMVSKGEPKVEQMVSKNETGVILKAPVIQELPDKKISVIDRNEKLRKDMLDLY